MEEPPGIGQTLTFWGIIGAAAIAASAAMFQAVVGIRRSELRQMRDDQKKIIQTQIRILTNMDVLAELLLQHMRDCPDTHQRDRNEARIDGVRHDCKEGLAG